MDRAALRAATVGAKKKFQKELVTLKDVAGPDGQAVVVEVRQPTVKKRSAIFSAAKALSGDPDKMDLGMLQVEAVLQLSHVPGTEELVFEEADRPNLLDQPAGSFVDDLTEVAMKLLNVDAAELEKNSAGTPGGRPSSP